ncbi:MAG TPA: HEAT repeat domain-containing protein [Verrucomicrobiae bacterium]|jgi:hypothetical protein
MSLALIQESANEVRRLAIAGSPLAVGDFRLKKFIAPLESAGAKVPVFAQVAKAIGEVVNGQEADSATNLLSLSTLLNAILYTQGQSGVNGDYRELETFPTNCTSTRTPARVLKPLVEALTSTGGGRYEVIKSAVERGAFNDLRLIDPAIRALGDNYPELADLVVEKILPAYGSGIVPRLKVSLDFKGKKEHARRLQLMHQLDPAGTLDLCKTALEIGSPEVKAAAIACLGEHDDCLPLVLEQANAKNKVLRAAALAALAKYDRPEITKLFTELIKGDELDILAGPLRNLRNAQVLNALLAEGKRVFDLLLKGDEEQIPRFVGVIECLKGRKDANSEGFILSSFAHGDKLGKLKAPKKSPSVSFTTGADLMDQMSWLLLEIGTPAALEAVLAMRDALPPSSFHQVIHCALRHWSPEQVFKEFSSWLGEAKGTGKEKAQILQQIILTTCGDDELDSDSSNAGLGTLVFLGRPKFPWDARWLDAAIKADVPAIVCHLARPNHKAAITYLLKLLEVKAKAQNASGLTIKALARCQYPELTEAFLKTLGNRIKGAQYVDYDLQTLLASARYLPAADLPKLDVFAAKLDEKFVDKFLEALAPLRPTTSTN